MWFTIFVAYASIISWTRLLHEKAGLLNFFKSGFNNAKNASIEGNPGIVEPGKFIIAFWISLSFNYYVAWLSYCSLYKELNYSLISELIGSVVISAFLIPLKEFLNILRKVEILFQA